MTTIPTTNPQPPGDPETEVQQAGTVASAPPPPTGSIVIIVLVISAIAALSLLWLASETHYRGCVEAAQVRWQSADDDLTRLARTQSLDGCSRLPF